MKEAVVISLDDVLGRVAGYVAIAGVKYPVKAIGAIGVQLVNRIPTEENPEPKNPAQYDDILALARELCPTLPESAWRDSTEIVGIVIGVSRTRLVQVESALPNSSGPTTSQSPAETPESRAG